MMVVDRESTLTMEEPRTKLAAERFTKLGVTGRTVVVDVSPDEKLELAVRNLPNVRVVSTGQLTARDVAGSRKVVLSEAAVEQLTKVVSS